MILSLNSCVYTQVHSDSGVKYNSPIKMRFLAALTYIKLSEIPQEACWDFKGLSLGLTAVSLWRISLPHSSQTDPWHQAWKKKQLAAPANTLKQPHITAAILNSRGFFWYQKAPCKGTPFLKHKGSYTCSCIKTHLYCARKMCDIIKVFPKVLNIISQIAHTFSVQIQVYLYKNNSQIKAKVQIIISKNLQSPTNIR